MGEFIDLSGKRFGHWVVIRKTEFIRNGMKPCIHWECLCDCGETREVMGSSLRSGVSQTCGCSRIAHLIESPPKRTHGGSKDRLFKVWRGMIDRCYYPSHNRYTEYGGRGIFICDKWKDDYSTFHDWALKNGYDPNAPRGKCTIDRKDVNGPYAPWNCRWVTMKVQANNKRNTNKEVTKCK